MTPWMMPLAVELAEHVAGERTLTATEVESRVEQLCVAEAMGRATGPLTDAGRLSAEREGFVAASYVEVIVEQMREAWAAKLATVG